MEEFELLGMPEEFYIGIGFGYLLTTLLYVLLYRFITKDDK